MIHQDLEEVYQYLTNFLTEERLQKIEYFSAQSSDFILPIMEDVYQFRNAAAIVRSAEACGLHRIVALEKINVCAIYCLKFLNNCRGIIFSRKSATSQECRRFQPLTLLPQTPQNSGTHHPRVDVRLISIY